MKTSSYYLIGNAGGKVHNLDGQTVKTQSIIRLMSELEIDFEYYDTESFSDNRLSIFRMFRKVCRADKLIYLPAQRNLLLIFPLIFILSKLFQTKIYYFVIGGWVAEYLQNKPLHCWMLKRIERICTETDSLKDRLQKEYAFNNAIRFDNYRYFDNSFVENHKEGVLRVVFCARVIQIKGIDTLLQMAQIFNEKYSGQVFVDVYGEVYPSEMEWRKNIQRIPNVEYKGVLNPSEIAMVLSKYDVSVLPTRYTGEGLPGAVVDAFVAGIPIIITEWQYAHEFIQDGVNGFIIPFGDCLDALKDKIIYLLEHENELSQMKRSAFESRSRFSAEVAREKFVGIVGF